MTNREKIDNMTDKDLAYFIVGSMRHCASGDNCDICPFPTKKCFNENAFEKWLSEEVEK